MPATSHSAWREQRARAVTAATGNLALIETRWTGAKPDLAAERAASAATVTVTELKRTSLESGEIEHGLRRWDADSPAIRAFERIDAFEYDETWVISGEFVPVSGERTVPFEHIRDNGSTRELVVPGDITVEIAGEQFTVAAFDDGGKLLLVFGDATNGSETYAPGRFLFVDRPAGDTGFVELDFNRAFVPPCGFSAQFNCPLPPASNRFPFPIRAGEKNVVFGDDFDIYTA
ncbi:DUF1684 domain-containing protein [Microbacterium marmarense]|uniref:DUF1684 domain-containing protein n=1 Tax=Microbacterium marmarense TaxID=3122051 RepID=A0ABU8LUZ6_9MICO